MRGELHGWLGRFLAATLGVAAGAGLATQLGPIERLRHAVADRMLRIAAEYPPPPLDAYPDVLVVGVDSRSLEAFPEQDDGALARMAGMIRRLDEAGARVIAIDLDLSGARANRELSRAIAQSGRVVLSAHPEIARGTDPAYLRGAAAIGVSTPQVDDDGRVRRAWRIDDRAGGVHPTLVEAALEAALGTQSDGRDPRPYAIDYRRASPRIPVLSALDAAEGRFDPRDVAGRVVFVGATAKERHDLWNTPLGANRPAVWIHAVSWRTRLAQRAHANTLRAVSTTGQLGLLLLLSVLGAALTAARLRWRMFGWTVLGLAAPATSLVLLVSRGLLLDPVLPLAVVGAHAALGFPMLRRGLGHGIRERDLSLSTLFTGSKLQAGVAHDDELHASLALLAEIAHASGLVLLRPQNGELVRDALIWMHAGNAHVGDVDTATLVLADRSLRVFENAVPGRPGAEGAAIYAPLFASDRAVGVLVLEQAGPHPLGDSALRTIVAVGTQLALSVENLHRIANLRRTFRATLTALAGAIDARDGYTDTHCRRIALFSGTMAERLGLPPDEVEAIELGALLHDVGKIGISDGILRKDGLLTQGERDDVEAHPDIGDRIVAQIDGISPITIGCVRFHHERWNGTGYPDGLAGEAIPLGARIVALVDVWDALSSTRPYKRAYPQSRVREIIEKEAGERFEPALVQLFFEILDEQGEDMLDLIAADEATEPRTRR